MSYNFSYGFMIKTHESMFALLCYGLLLQFSSLNFTNLLGIFSFIAAILLLAYLIYGTINLYLKMNG
jgi:hypothetical protein